VLDGAARDARFRTTRVDPDKIAMGRVYFCEHLTLDWCGGPSGRPISTPPVPSPAWSSPPVIGDGQPSCSAAYSAAMPSPSARGGG